MRKFIRLITLVLALGVLISSLGVLSCFALNVEDYYLEKDVFYGDTDGDLKITVKDATAVQKHLAKILELERKPQMIADVDGNGKLSISDATEIQKYLANLIHCFKADPTEYCEADGEAVRVELTTEDTKKITVNISKEGYYRFMSRRIEGGTCSFSVYDGNDYLCDAYGDASVLDVYAYLKAGKYLVHLDPSWEYEKDVTDFSVTSAPNKMPFDFADVTEIKAGERLDVKAGTGTAVYKLDPACLEDPAEGLILYTKGEEPRASFKVYDEMLLNAGSSYTLDDGVNTETNLLEGVRYVAVTQEEGGSDFTLCCDGYFDYIDPLAKEIKLDETDCIELTEYSNPEGKSYRVYVRYKFTPDESGYYKISFGFSDAVWGANPYYIEKPEQIKLNRIQPDEDVQYSVDYLNAGTTYYLIYGLMDWDSMSTADIVLTKSTEQEYNDWYIKFTSDDGGFTEPEHDVIGLGEKEAVILSPEYEDGWYTGTNKTFKFTAEKDMTVVAYTEGSADAYADIYGSKGWTFWCNDSGNLSEDFTVLIELKAGESCYFVICSNELDDSFYFSIVDIEDYVPLN